MAAIAGGCHIEVKYIVKCIGGTSGWPPWTGGRHMEVAAKAGLTVYIYIYIYIFIYLFIYLFILLRLVLKSRIFDIL